MPKTTKEPRRWYAWSKVFQAQPLELRKKVFQSKSIRCQLARLAVLHPTFGRALDDAFAPLRVAVFVSWPPDDPERPRMVVQKARLDRVMEHFLAGGKWPSYALLSAWRAEDRQAIRALREGPQAPPSSTPPAAEDALANAFLRAAEHQHPTLAAHLRQFVEKHGREAGKP
jgi:hypothetical protein